MPRTQATKLDKGVVYTADTLEQPLPIHRRSNYYVEGKNSVVIPDGTNFVRVYSNKGTFAAHVIDDRHSLIRCIDEQQQEAFAVVHEWDVVNAYDEHDNTVRFLSEKAAELSGYDFSIRVGRYAKKDSRMFYGSDRLLGYHTSDRFDEKCRKSMPQFVTEADDWRFGIEVEKVDLSLYEEGNVYEMLHKTGWVKETDGSLSSGGYEFISPLLPLFKTDVVVKACEPVKHLLEGKINGTCGGHFNISKKGVEPIALAKSFKNFMPLLYALYPTRTVNRYCPAKKFNIYIEANDKYNAIYIKNNCVEIRLFGGVKSTDQLLWRVQLMQLLIDDLSCNLNQVIMKVASSESKLYKLLSKHYTNDEIKHKVQLFYYFANKYEHGKISPSVKTRICTQFQDNLMFNDTVLEAIYQSQVYPPATQG